VLWILIHGVTEGGLDHYGDNLQNRVLTLLGIPMENGFVPKIGSYDPKGATYSGLWEKTKPSSPLRQAKTVSTGPPRILSDTLSTPVGDHAAEVADGPGA
jgi:hypothetical protein